MKNEEIELLHKVLNLLERDFSNADPQLVAQYKSLCDKFREKNEKEKQYYKDNQEYHRNYSRTWAQEHPEQVKKHKDDYKARKQQGKMLLDER